MKNWGHGIPGRGNNSVGKGPQSGGSFVMLLGQNEGQKGCRGALSTLTLEGTSTVLNVSPATST